MGIYVCDNCGKPFPDHASGREHEKTCADLRTDRDEAAISEEGASLKHFVRLANRGKHNGASGGEKAARKMAMAMLDEGLRLDGTAVDGLIDFIRSAKVAPETARDLIGGW